MKTNQAKTFAGVLAMAVCLGCTVQAWAFYPVPDRRGGAAEQLGLTAEVRDNVMSVPAAVEIPKKDPWDPSLVFKVTLSIGASGQDIIKEFKFLREALLHRTEIKNVDVSGFDTDSRAEKKHLDADPATEDEIKVFCDDRGYLTAESDQHSAVVTYKEKDGFLLKEIYDEHTYQRHVGNGFGDDTIESSVEAIRFTAVVDEGTGTIVRTQKQTENRDWE